MHAFMSFPRSLKLTGFGERWRRDFEVWICYLHLCVSSVAKIDKDLEKAVVKFLGTLSVGGKKSVSLTSGLTLCQPGIVAHLGVL
jgi:hypothetical protein